jgi:DNA repair exonuclease SbcCD ATPase subunit
MAANKLVFNKVRAKNFRSIGNMMIELDYQASSSTLIASEANGSGKSTLAIWALYFVLFGEPYSKDCKIGGLVNSKSGKDCVVELEFETMGAKWHLRRGYKPALFELFKDGKLIENEAAGGDMQKYLQNITGLRDKRAFCNIVALGIDRFVPFVQMKTAERREFVEQMLDMVVISEMNSITKDKVKAIRKQIEQVNYEIGIAESKLAGRQRTVAILEEKKQQRLNESGSELKTFEEELGKIVRMINAAEEKISAINEQRQPEALPKLEQVKQMLNRFKFKIDEIKRGADNITDLHDCPTCKQGVTEEHKAAIRANAEAEAGKLLEPMQKLEGERLKHQEVVNNNDRLSGEATKVIGLKMQLDVKLSSTQNAIKSIKDKMVDSNEDALIQTEKDESDKLSKDVDAKTVELNSLSDQETDHLQLLQILKDDGIKANIVAQYVPFLNQTINSILDRLNLYVQINIDSEFNVSMFAPDRKGQTIGNLSTGQLRRIDLAVLLAWREIAKNKASVDCNVLILDEILENLSASGVEEFMDMWQAIGQETNLIVISQREAEFDQYFDRTVKYSLKNDMTVEV